MKVRIEQLQALQKDAEVKAKPKAGIGFDAFLNEELGGVSHVGSPASGQGLLSSSAVLGLEAAAFTESAATVPAAEGLEMVAASLDSLLDGLDEYASALAAPQGADLRKAYGILQEMDKGLASLRENAPNLATRHGGMASLLDELSVIARTETVKLNRGDYL